MLPLLLLLACAAPPPPATVVVVGIDGGDWDVLDPWIAAGKLPSLAWMRQHGATAPLQESSGMSPESWTTLVTGQPPSVHGIIEPPGGVTGFFQARPDQLKVHRVWDMAGARKRRSLVVDWWVTAPPYPIEGVLLSRESKEAWPPGAQRESLDPLQPTRDADDMKRLGLLAPRSGNMRAYLAKGGFDLYLLPYYGLDHALHALWGEWAAARNPAVTPDDRIRRGDDLVLDAAVFADTILSWAYHAAGDQGYVVVVSDHGFGPATPCTRRVALSRSFLDGGEGTAEAGDLVVGDATLHLGTQEVPRESPVAEMSCNLVYPEITVDGPQAAAVRARLLAAREGDAPVLVSAGDALVPSDAVLDAAWTALGRLDAVHYSVWVNAGAHRREDDGILGVWGPGVVPGPIAGDVRAVDVTPTILWLMGLPTGEDMAGRPLTTVLSTRRPVQTVPTWEDGLRPWVVPGATIPPDREQLKALGYIGPSSPADAP